MKRILTISLMVGLLWILAGCGGGGDSDKVWAPKKEAVIALEEFADDFEKAQTKEEIAKALNDYSDKIEAMEPRLNAMLDNPEYDPNAVPRYIQNRESKASNRWTDIDDKITLNMDDPEIKKAYQRFVQCTNLSKGN